MSGSGNSFSFGCCQQREWIRSSAGSLEQLLIGLLSAKSHMAYRQANLLKV